MRPFFVFILLMLSVPVRAEITLGDLGVDHESAKPATDFPVELMQARRSSLETHQILGLTTLGTMLATAFTGNGAMDSDLHMYLGMTTAGLYAATAYYSLSAPRPAGLKDKGLVTWHKALAWVHAPLMVITPYLGYMYKKHEDEGKKHSALEKQHSAFAGALLGTFSLSATLMFMEF